MRTSTRWIVRDFGDVASNSAATRTVSLRTNNLKTPGDFVVESAESTVSGVAVAVKPGANKGEFEITLQLEQDAKPGVLDGNVLIHTNDRWHPLVTIPIKGTIR